MTFVWVEFLVLVATITRTGFSWPQGAPFKMCVNSFPKHHGTEQQLTPSPFQILVNQSTYRPSQVLRVILRPSDLTKFRGFQIGARQASSFLSSSSSFGEDNDVVVGEWIEPDPQTRLQYWYPEKQGTFNCATHRDNSDKEEVVLFWKAPSQDVGDIVFRSGFVVDFNTFWSNVKSDTVRSQLGGRKIPMSPPVSPKDVTFSTGDCGRSKGCFLHPDHCQDESCLFGVTYKYLGDTDGVHFEMIGRSEDYISLALSADDKMGSDETVTCISSGTRNVIQHGYNPARHNDQHRNIDLSDKRVLRKDGRIICSFLRPLRTNLTYIIENHLDGYRNVTDQLKTFDLSAKHFIHLAWGSLYKESNMIKKHVESPLVSTRLMDLLRNDVTFAASIPTYLKVHAILGFFAWVFLSTCAMIIARHYRQVLTRQCVGTATWFQLHRCLMFTSLITTTVLIIIIFVSVGQWSQTATNHAILGLTTTSLAVLQIFFGMIRPGLDSKHRPIFNYFHRTVAIVTQILAVTTMILGARMDLLSAELRYTLTVIIVASLSVLIFLEMVLECIRICIKMSAKVTQTPRADDSQLQMEPEIKGQSRMDILTSVKRFFLFLFVLAAATSLVVFIVYVSLA